MYSTISPLALKVDVRGRNIYRLVDNPVTALTVSVNLACRRLCGCLLDLCGTQSERYADG